MENEELNVYNFQDAYYILDRIPGSLAGAEDMDRCYLVSNEVAEYIMGMASDRKQGWLFKCHSRFVDYGHFHDQSIKYNLKLYFTEEIRNDSDRKSVV